MLGVYGRPDVNERSSSDRAMIVATLYLLWINVDARQRRPNGAAQVQGNSWRKGIRDLPEDGLPRALELPGPREILKVG